MMGRDAEFLSKLLTLIGDSLALAFEFRNAFTVIAIRGTNQLLLTLNSNFPFAFAPLLATFAGSAVAIIAEQLSPPGNGGTTQRKLQRPAIYFIVAATIVWAVPWIPDISLDNIIALFWLKSVSYWISLVATSIGLYLVVKRPVRIAA